MPGFKKQKTTRSKGGGVGMFIRGKTLTSGSFTQKREFKETIDKVSEHEKSDTDSLVSDEDLKKEEDDQNLASIKETEENQNESDDGRSHGSFVSSDDSNNDADKE